MSDQDTFSPDVDDELRARLEAFADAVQEQTDTEAALQRVPRRSRPPTIRLLAIAACFVLAIVLVAVVIAERQSVDTVPPSESPSNTTECPDPAQPRAIAPGGQMNIRFAKPVATAATAILLLGACSDDDDGATTLAEGQDIDFVGSGGFADQTMDVTAEEQDGEVTGEMSFEPHGSVADIQCADTETDDLVVLAGQVTTPPDDGDEAVGAWWVLAIREGDPDRALIWFTDPGTASCADALEQVPDDVLSDDNEYDEVEDGDDIETG